MITTETYETLIDAIDNYNIYLSLLSDAISDAVEESGSAELADAEPDLGVPEKITAIAKELEPEGEDEDYN